MLDDCREHRVNDHAKPLTSIKWSGHANDHADESGDRDEHLVGDHAKERQDHDEHHAHDHTNDHAELDDCEFRQVNDLSLIHI